MGRNEKRPARERSGSKGESRNVGRSEKRPARKRSGSKGEARKVGLNEKRPVRKRSGSEGEARKVGRNEKRPARKRARTSGTKPRPDFMRCDDARSSDARSRRSAWKAAARSCGPATTRSKRPTQTSAPALVRLETDWTLFPPPFPPSPPAPFPPSPPAPFPSSHPAPASNPAVFGDAGCRGRDPAGRREAGSAREGARELRGLPAAVAAQPQRTVRIDGTAAAHADHHAADACRSAPPAPPHPHRTPPYPTPHPPPPPPLRVNHRVLRFVVVCGDGEYIIYTALAWRNKMFGQALEFVWGADANECVQALAAPTAWSMPLVHSR